jgi:hypothetical protein
MKSADRQLVQIAEMLSGGGGGGGVGSGPLYWHPLHLSACTRVSPTFHVRFVLDQYSNN